MIYLNNDACIFFYFTVISSNSEKKEFMASCLPCISNESTNIWVLSKFSIPQRNMITMLKRQYFYFYILIIVALKSLLYLHISAPFINIMNINLCSVLFSRQLHNKSWYIWSGMLQVFSICLPFPYRVNLVCLINASR